MEANHQHRCRRCDYLPASPKFHGYCSWDCFDEDDELCVTTESHCSREGDRGALAAAGR